jgi:hypothetical protein
MSVVWLNIKFIKTLQPTKSNLFAILRIPVFIGLLIDECNFEWMKTFCNSNDSNTSENWNECETQNMTQTHTCCQSTFVDYCEIQELISNEFLDKEKMFKFS